MSGAGLLTCPVCGEPLQLGERVADCHNNHSFDRAREGYFNLLRSGKAGDRTGDPKEQARSRRDFLDRGYYAPLRDALVGELASSKGALLDICCGEGYYTSAFGRPGELDAYGFDLSREMVRLAAKRGRGTYFVANLKAIPVASGAFAVATHLFAPFHESEFARVLRPGGVLYTVMPGARHLWGLKERLYDTPYLNDERLPQTRELQLEGTRKVCAHVTLASAADIDAVFRMTPYYYRTRESDRARLAGLQQLETDLEFVIARYRKNGK